MAYKGYEPIIPDITEWPIYKMSARRYEFIQEVISVSMQQCLELFPERQDLLDELARTLYQERVRVYEKPWKADPEDEKEYWSSARRELLQITGMNDEPDEQYTAAKQLLNSIISRYVNEIVGNFDPSVYEFAKHAIPFGFSRLLKTTIGLKFKERLNNKFKVRDRIVYEGDLDTIRELGKTHTLIMVPTHISNIDSILVGWAIHDIGLPAFIYGAGLNLFGIRILAYMMGRLGAYKVDRRKKNTIYLETLKIYSKLAIHQGVHSLFFPGGTRSRSGEVEKKLKLGLMGTAMDAQYLNYKETEEPEKAKKIIVLPVTMSYHFVLEAQSLINDHLEITGKELYLKENDRYSTSFKMLNFIRKFLTKSSKIYLSFAPPMDLFGHVVDKQGNSYDNTGKRIDVDRYFKFGGELLDDPQRNEEYTKLLAETIVRKYHDYQIVVSSSLLAYTAFNILKKRYKKQDLYNLLRLPADDRVIPYDLFAETVERLRQKLLEMEKMGKVKTPRHIKEESIDDLIAHGLKNIGLYHDKKALTLDKEGNIVSEDMKLLLFYHNRLEGYQLAQYV